MSKYGDKGAIYLCTKKETKKGFELQLVEQPGIKISGEDLEWCKVEICMQIMQWNGDGEAVLEIIPELKKRHKTGIEMYRSLGYNEDVKLLNTNDLFTGGICPKCKYGIGERTDELLNMAEKPSTRYGIVSVRARTRREEEDFPRIFPVIKLYRKKVIELLTQEEKNLFEQREVLYKGKESDFLELIPKDVIAQCGHKGAEYPKIYHQTWKCNKCMRTQFTVSVKELYSEPLSNSTPTNQTKPHLS